MKVGDCVVVTEGAWVVGRVVQQKGKRYEVECASWPELRRWVEEERVRPVGWLLKLGQAARILALTVRWALGDDLGYRALCDALGMVIRTGLEGVRGE
jgi:hypothetical protein